jgi:CoA:oxalate CoA-transferase
MTKKPFEGLKALDFSLNVAGPMCGTLLADFGCDVIKVERPKVGDEARGFGPFVDKTSVVFNALNRGKRSIALPLKDPDAMAVIHELIKKVDILIQSYRPGFMESIGLGYEDVAKINPRLIYVSVSLYGKEGKYASAGGYDMMAQALSGLIHMNGHPNEPPVPSGFTVCDEASALNGFAGIATALYSRERTGEGQHVDIGLFNVAFALNDYSEMASFGFDIKRSGFFNPSLVPYGIYSNKAGYLLILAISPNLWAGLCQLMGKEELTNHPDYATNGKRLERKQEVHDMVTAWLQTFDELDTPERLLNDRQERRRRRDHLKRPFFRGILKHKRNRFHQRGQFHIFNIRASDFNASIRHVVKPRNEMRDCAFPAAGRSDNRRNPALFRRERNAG